jgi:hypothetical protein
MAGCNPSLFSYHFPLFIAFIKSFFLPGQEKYGGQALSSLIS